MKLLVQAYDKDNHRILGNLDGQGIYEAGVPTRCKWYQRLQTCRTLRDRVARYEVRYLDSNMLHSVIYK